MSGSIWEKAGPLGGAVDLTGSGGYRRVEPPVTGPVVKPAGRPDVVVGINGNITFGSGPGPGRKPETPPDVTASEKKPAAKSTTNGSMWLRGRQPNS